jgi:hypothetical protein
MGGVALAHSSHSAKAPIQAGNASCGGNETTDKVIGTTSYHRLGDTVKISYDLKHALPNSEYTVELWGNSCEEFAVVGEVITNKKGVAKVVGDVTVPAGSVRFFATSLGPEGFNDTPAVELLP